MIFVADVVVAVEFVAIIASVIAIVFVGKGVVTFFSLSERAATNSAHAPPSLDLSEFLSLRLDDARISFHVDSFDGIVVRRSRLPTQKGNSLSRTVYPTDPVYLHRPPLDADPGPYLLQEVKADQNISRVIMGTQVG